MPTCIFFARGNCARGSECRFDHPQSLHHSCQPDTRTSLRADVPEFLPASSSNPLCRFYSLGGCRNGSDCPYFHPTHSGNHPNREAAIANLPSTSGLPHVERLLKGVCVRFGEGTKVLDVKFLSDDTQLSAVHGHLPATKVQVSTVLCSWYNPSRIVWLHYRSSCWATNASKRFDKRLHGRQIRTKIQPPSKHHGRPKSIWSVQLNNVSTETTKEDLREQLRGAEPDHIVFGTPTSQKTQQEAVDWVRRHITQSGRKLRSFNLEPTATGSRMKAFACFDSPSDVRAVIALAQNNIRDLGSRLFVEMVAAVAIPVLRELHTVLKDKFDELQTNHNDSVRISAYDHREVKLVMLRIYGPKSQAVAHVKAKVGEMLTGVVVLDDSGSALWHDFFTSDEGLSSLKSVSEPGKVFIYRDLRKQNLELYGSKTLFEDTRRAIIQLLDSHSSFHLITLEGELFAATLSGGLRRLVRKFGKKSVKLDILQKPPVIVFRGSARDLELAKSLILNCPEEAECQHVDSSEECPYCFSDADDPVKLRCGHTYCRCCFESLCEEVKHNRVPIVCFGNCSNCGHIVSLNELKRILNHHRFEAALEASFEFYIRSQPDKIQYCSTPDCPTIYKACEEAGVFTCVNCLTSICVTCRRLSHDGLSCQQAEDETTASRETEKYKKENNIKDCPKCGTAMYKEDGCNHMICGGCGIHLCWACLETFAVEDECYRHLQSVHGTIGNLDPEELQRAELALANWNFGPREELVGRVVNRP